jgi:hypothetical protein
VTSHHLPPFSGDPRSQGTKENPQPTSGGPDPSTRAARPPPSAQRAPTSRRSPLHLLLSRRDFLRRISTAKRTHSVRIRVNKRQHHSMLANHWLELRSASLLVYHRHMAPPSPLPRSLSNIGWIRNPSYRIRLDPPKGAPFPYRHSPPGSPPQLRPDPIPPDLHSHVSTSPKTGPNGITPASDLADLPNSLRADRDTTLVHSPDSPSTVVGLKFLTINAQKAGTNSPSMADLVTMLDQHPPDFLFLTETPLHPHSGALLHALRNRGYRIHHHPSNASF